MEQLSQNPITEVLGVVQASGASGGKIGKEGNWILRFAFEAWKYAGGEIQNRKLPVCKSVSKEELRPAMDRIKPFSVLRIRVRIGEQNPPGNLQALLVEIIGIDNSDADLNQLALKLQEPVTIEDARLGIFTLERRFNWYETDTLWGSANIRLRLPSARLEEVKKILAQAYSLWDSQKSWNDRISDYAATRLLSLKNKTWLGEGEKGLTAEQFKGKIELESISLKSDGNFDFWYKDGDLFWGHSIRVSGNLSDGPRTACIEG